MSTFSQFHQRLRDIINVASEGWQWPAEEPPHSDKLLEPRFDEAEKQCWRELAAEEWRRAHAPSVEDVFAVEVLSPEENRVIGAFKQEVRAAEEFEDKKRRARARFDANLQRAFIDLCGELNHAYGQQPSVGDEGTARVQDIVALLAIAHFLDQLGGSKGALAYFANRFAKRAYTLQDATIANRSDPSLVWVSRAFVSLAVERLRKRGHKRKAAAEWIAKRHPELRQLITEKTAWDAKRSQSLTTAINSWSRDFGRRDDVKIKNYFANKIYSRGLKALEAAQDCNDDDQIEALLQEALHICS
jgi:hypothetical protein